MNRCGVAPAAVPVFVMEPLHGIGAVRLGSSRAAMREALAEAGFALESSRGALDFFCEAAIQVECGPDERVRFVGVSSSERFVVRFRGQDVFALGAEELFALVAAVDGTGAHRFVDHGYCFPGQIFTLWDADEQYDRRGGGRRPVWAQVGLGDAAYAAAIADIRAGA